MLSLFDLFERVSSGSVREAKVSMGFEICEVEQIPYPYHVSYIYIILLILIPSDPCICDIYPSFG